LGIERQRVIGPHPERRRVDDESITGRVVVADLDHKVRVLAAQPCNEGFSRIPPRVEEGEQARPAVLAALRRGARIALVSDAGTPLVSDPGYKLVRAAIAENLPVTVTPGPSAVLAALILSINLLGDWLRDALNPRLR